MPIKPFIKNRLDNIAVYYLLVIASITILFFSINYTGNEGFNPSDDGVVLAQSYRILHGEVPHHDFIAIRPVFSGVLHSIHFFSPLPLMDSARWFVVLQFLMIAFAFSRTWHNLKEAIGEKNNSFFEVFIFIMVFTLTILNYNLFPWTTIDAVFWSMLALWIFFNHKIRSKNLKYFFTILLFAFAALSRQNFLLPAIIINIIIAIRYIRAKSFFSGFLVMLMAWVPAWIYAFILLYNHSVPAFISQMTGRTEFFETGILQFIKMAVKPPFILPNLLAGILLINHLFDKKRNNAISTFLHKQHIYIIFLFIAWAISLVVYHFSISHIDIIALPFGLFWLLADTLVIYCILPETPKKVIPFYLLILLVAYTSAISLGDNSPVFATGILSGGFITLSAIIFKLRYPGFKKAYVLKVALGILTLFIFTLGIFSQERINYRDLPANELSFSLKSVNTEFGSIKTNRQTGAYYNELARIYSELDHSQNNTVVLPHNAAFYPVFHSSNPLPLDWMQEAEYIGSEQRVNDAVEKLCKNKGIYFIIDKFNIKTLFYKQEELDKGSFSYLPVIYSSCTKLPVKSTFFEVYETR